MLWTSIGRRIKLEPYLSPIQKINCKRIKDFNIRPETLKPLEKNVSEILLDLDIGKNFQLFESCLGK